MTKIVFVTESGVGLDTEAEMLKFFEDELKPRLLELLYVILHQEFTVGSIETKKLGPCDPSPKIFVELNGNTKNEEEAISFVMRWLRIEHPGMLREV